MPEISKANLGRKAKLRSVNMNMEIAEDLDLEVAEQESAEPESELEIAERELAEKQAVLQVLKDAEKNKVQKFLAEFSAMLADMNMEIPASIMKSGIVTFKVEVKRTVDGNVYSTALDTGLPEPKLRTKLDLSETYVEGDSVKGTKTPAFFGLVTGDIIRMVHGGRTFPIQVVDANAHDGLRLGSLVGTFNKIALKICQPKHRTIRGPEAILAGSLVVRGDLVMKMTEYNTTTATGTIGKSWRVAA
jgi:hypothetical protein